MALQQYITVSDMMNKVFNRFTDPTKQLYVDMANNELEDLAKRKGVKDLTTINTPIHFKLKEYLKHWAVAQLAQDNANFNSKDGLSGEDEYERLFKREMYQIQSIKKGITYVMFTDEEETPQNRAVYSQRTVRG